MYLGTASKFPPPSLPGVVSIPYSCFMIWLGSTMTRIYVYMLWYLVCDISQLNAFYDGTHATFEHSVDNKVDNNIYPDGFTFFIDDDTCFRAGTDPVC